MQVIKTDNTIIYADCIWFETTNVIVDKDDEKYRIPIKDIEKIIRDDGTIGLDNSLKDTDKKEVLKKIDDTIYEAVAFNKDNKNIISKEENDMIDKIRTKAYEYEKGKMMRDDSRVEIDDFDGEIWISDYSPSRKSAEPIEMICTEDDVNIDELVKMCEDEGFMYCI